MPKTVLLADDSVVIQKLVGLSFANEDLRLITTDNGDDALTRARESKPDLVLADVVMPGRNGYELCQAIKQDPDLSRIPVLLLTGTFEAFDDERAHQVGSAGHITKPFEAQALVDRVQELLARSPEPIAAAAPAIPTLAEAPRAALPEAEPTMIVEPDEAYDFFDDDEADLTTVEPVAEEPAVDLGVGDVDEAFDFGLDPVADLEPQSPVIAPQEPVAKGPQPGGDMTVAMVPERPPAEPPPQLIPEDPMATRLAFDEPLGAPAFSGAGQTPEAMPPAPPPIREAPPRIANEDSFGAQNTAPPLPAADPPPTQIIEGLSHDVPPPLPPSAYPGETILADDLFAGPAPLPSAPITPHPPQEIASSAENEDLEFSFNTGPSTTRPAATLPRQQQPPPIPSLPAPTADPFARGASEPAATTDPLIDTLDMDPLAGSLGAEPLATSPANDLLSGSMAAEDFAADVGAESDLLQSFSARDAADYDVSSSDLGDPLRTGDPGLLPAADISSSDTAPDATPGLPQPMPEQQEMAATPLDLQTEEPADALVVEEIEETAPALASEETPGSSTATPDISPMMRDRIHETLEKVAWEAFADLSDTIVRQVVQKVEQIAWEVVPQMAESLIQEEIRRLKDEPEDE